MIFKKRICQAKYCNKKRNIQFIMVRNSRRPMIDHKEYYCPKHLRERAYQLEALKISGKITKELFGSK